MHTQSRTFLSVYGCLWFVFLLCLPFFCLLQQMGSGLGIKSALVGWLVFVFPPQGYLGNYLEK
jgi:hypothetical protein